MSDLTRMMTPEAIVRGERRQTRKIPTRHLQGHRDKRNDYAKTLGGMIGPVGDSVDVAIR